VLLLLEQLPSDCTVTDTEMLPAARPWGWVEIARSS
jgi:hypothetical protein